ncbi:thioredoxin domain-containing protein 11 isoform X2 [Heteronotia binoei]|uniref:thioredoxin domain-containing protein 11 isoform X2 n=1 Tax=Heteronotia binoei TaxID=13085 RepID=UPI00292F9AAE|nr:thioredoxin domain-containing protein 11 isoform X2 [Heteronotia binoei]
MPEAETLLLLPSDLLVPSEPGVLGYFEFNASPQPPGYLTFFTSALHSLGKDYLGTIHFGVITDKLIAKEIPLTNSGSVYLHRHVNTSLLYPCEAMNYTAENIYRWALENQETFVRWLRPHGGKSLLLNNELKKGPALFLFLPFNPLAENQPLVDEISSLALAYKSCNGSGQERPGPDRSQGRGGGETLPIAQSRCCNTVLLPPQLAALSHSHNVCELCVNQSAGVQPSRLGVLHCSSLEIEAALDSFYLKERTFSQVVSKTAALCSNFLGSYSPFSYYTACCQTVHRGLLSLHSSPQSSPLLPSGVAISSRGERWGEEPPRSAPHIEDGSGLPLDGAVPLGSAVTGLSCRSNKTLNLYLLDSNLFWMYAERLGAPRAASPKAFAAIVDLKEEVHYVLDQAQALIQPHLETFIQNYSVLYSPLKRHLVGNPQSIHFAAQRRIREVTTDTFREVVLKSDKDTLLLYYAPWCGFCMVLNHVFIQLARILPENFIVARVDVSQNDLPWEFMTHRLPNVVFFPRQRKDQSVKFPEEFPITLPNLLKFLLRHSSPPSSSGPGSQPCLKECRVSLLERELQQLRAEIQALREAQALLRAQLWEVRKEEQRLQQERRAWRKQEEALQSQREHLQGLCDQKARELEGLAHKLQDLAEASKTLLAENTLLKFLLASLEGGRRAQAEPDSHLAQEEGSLAAEEEEEEEESTPLEATVALEHSKDNWTEQPT